MSPGFHHITKNIIGFLCLMMFFVACHHTQKDSILYEYKGRYPDESAENMHIVMSNNGKLNFIIETPLLNRYNSSSEKYADCPQGIKILSYNEAGEQQAILTAKYAKELNNTTYKASKDVVIIDLIKGDTLRTEEITWDKLTHTIFSNTLVKQTKTDGSVNYGDGFTADDLFTHYTILHPRGEISGFDF